MLPSRQAIAACALVRSSSTTRQANAAASLHHHFTRRNSSSHSTPNNVTASSAGNEAPPAVARPEPWRRNQRPATAAPTAAARLEDKAIVTQAATSTAHEPSPAAIEAAHAYLDAEFPLSASEAAQTTDSSRPEAERWSSRWDWRMTAPSRYGETLHGRIAQPLEHNMRRIGATAALLRAGERTQALKDDVKKYQETQTMLLELELKMEERELEERREQPTWKLVRAGLAIDRLAGYYRTQRKYGRRVAVLQRTAARPFPWTRIKLGDAVEIFPDVEEERNKPLQQGFGAAFGEEPEPIFFDEEDVDSFPSTKATEEAATPPAPVEEAAPKKLRAEPVKASVVEITQHKVTLHFERDAAHLDFDRGKWTIMQGRNELVHKRLMDTLRCMSIVLAAQEAALPPPLTPTASPEVLGDLGITPNEIMFRGTDLVDVILAHGPAKGGGAFKGDMMLESWINAREGKGNVVHVEGDPDLGLNRSQERAVAMMLGNRLSLVQGPPGTGKTHTIVAAVKLLKLHFQVPHPILLCAHTNVAVDNLALGAKRAGLKVVRAGDGDRLTHDELRGRTLDELMGGHAKKAIWDDMRAALVQKRQECFDLERNLRNRTVLEEEARADGIITTPQQAYANAARGQNIIAELKQSIVKLHQSAFMLEQVMLAEILRDTDVICATAIASVSSRLRAVDFPVVFFDEGSQATESITLVPLMKGAKHLSIIGDHRQLPPVVASVEARKLGLSLSLFERLIKRGDVPSTMLDVQHRMHPVLSEFPNAAFYKGALQNGASTSSIAPLKSAFVSPPLIKGASIEGTQHERLTFLTHSHPEQRNDKSLRNPGEAELVGRIIADLLVQNPELQGSQIGIVAPYAAQVKLLRQTLHDPTSAQRHALEAHLQHLGQRSRASELSSIEVHTVDGFEGREKLAIVFSSVRSNEEGFVGFLADARRMCVALTRAKSGLWILGNLATWEAAKLSEVGASTVDAPDTNVLKEYAEWVEKKGLVVDASY